MPVVEEFPMIEVSIPSMEKEVDDSGKSKKVRTCTPLRTACFTSYSFYFLMVSVT